MFIQIVSGFLLGVIVSLGAWRLGSLSKSGAVGAAVTGGLIFGFGGLPWGVLLLTFFITSSALSKTYKGRKEGLSEKFSKGHQRDLGQVLANGGLGSLLAIVLLLTDGETWVWYAYAGAMAAVNADTWATELGVLNPTNPRLITNWKMVDPGTSGGVSLLGTVSSLVGAALIGSVGVIFSPPGEAWRIFLAVVIGGLAGSIFDSLLGATIQAIYYCPECKKETEWYPNHSCGIETHRIRGLNWLNNDLVNFLASLMGALVAFVIWLLFS